MFELEIGEDSSTSHCHCCGADSYTGHGFIYKNGVAHAVYYVGWSPHHRERGASMAIAVGRWDESSTAEDRVCFGLEAFEGESQILFRFINPEESPWPTTELLGQMIPREEALALRSSIREDVLSIGEHVIRCPPAVRTFLRVPVQA